MSFLSELKQQKDKLKQTETIVTNINGNKYKERGSECEKIDESSYGFVVDTKPDNIPVMILQHLYIGSQDCTEESVLNAYNIKHVTSLGIAVSLPQVNFKYIECLDLPETEVGVILSQALPFINTAVEKQENVLVHCNAGVSRTALVAIAYLMHYQNMTYEFAYNVVKSKRPAIQPNAGFVKQLKCLKTGRIL